MSNYVRQTRTITIAEYNRLVRQAAEAASLSGQVTAMSTLNSNLNSIVNGLNNRLNDAERRARDTRAELQAANAANAAKHEALRIELQNVIANTDARIENTRRETVQAMNDMRVEFNNNLVNTIESNNRNIEAAMNRNNAIITGRINALRDATNNALNEVNANINAIIANDTALLEQAQEYREQTQVLQDMIGSTRHVLLIPGGYQSVLDAIKQAETDIALAAKNPANSPVARNNARIAFEEAVRFYESVRIAENEWQMQLSVAEQLAEVVANQLENSRTIEPRPGKELDVDYWSNGDLSSHSETLDRLRDQIDNPYDLSKDDLINIQSALRSISENVENTYNNAYVAIVTSQSVADEAEKIRAELAATGAFVVTDHAYEGNDKRGNYRFIVHNPSGLTVVITVSVTRENGVSIHTEADILDYGNMAKEDAEEYVNGVMARLSGKTPDSWNTTGTQCHNRGGVVCHPERADMHAWKEGRREHATEAPERTNINTRANN